MTKISKNYISSYSNYANLPNSTPFLDSSSVRKGSLDFSSQNATFATPVSLGYQNQMAIHKNSSRPSSYQISNNPIKKLALDIPEKSERPSELYYTSPKFNDEPTLSEREHRYLAKDKTTLKGSYSVLPESEVLRSGQRTIFRPSVVTEDPQQTFQFLSKDDNELNFNLYGTDLIPRDEKVLLQRTQPITVSSKNILSRDVSLEISRIQERPTVRETNATNMPSFGSGSNFASSIGNSMVKTELSQQQKECGHGYQYQDQLQIEDPYKTMQMTLNRAQTRPEPIPNQLNQSCNYRDEERKLFREPLAPFKILPFGRSVTASEVINSNNLANPFRAMISDIYSSNKPKTSQESSNHTKIPEANLLEAKPEPKITHSSSLYEKNILSSPMQNSFSFKSHNLEPLKHEKTMCSPLMTGIKNQIKPNVQANLALSSHLDQPKVYQSRQEAQFASSRSRGYSGQNLEASLPHQYQLLLNSPARSPKGAILGRRVMGKSTEGTYGN